jgi:AcrR family transcriptional regulator
MGDLPCCSVMGEHESSTRRAGPSQARSVVTSDRILDAATQVLVEKGLQGFNTNAVAEAAGLTVGTLYHHFRDKNDLLRVLSERDQAVRTEYVRAHVGEFSEVTDLDQWVHGMLAALANFRRRQPATLALRRACRAVPELIAAEEAVNDELAVLLGKMIRSRYPNVAPRRATLVGRTVNETVRTMLDSAGEYPRRAAAMRRELELMIGAYLRQLEQD